jgi:hypothetical protein
VVSLLTLGTIATSPNIGYRRTRPAIPSKERSDQALFITLNMVPQKGNHEKVRKVSSNLLRPLRERFWAQLGNLGDNT